MFPVTSRRNSWSARCTFRATTALGPVSASSPALNESTGLAWRQRRARLARFRNRGADLDAAEHRSTLHAQHRQVRIRIARHALNAFERAEDGGARALDGQGRWHDDFDRA